MFDQLTTDLEIEDKFIVNRIKFIKQLTIQRKLKIKFELIQHKDNLANKILKVKEIKTKSKQLRDERSITVCGHIWHQFDKRETYPITLTAFHLQLERSYKNFN